MSDPTDLAKLSELGIKVRMAINGHKNDHVMVCFADILARLALHFEAYADEGSADEFITNYITYLRGAVTTVREGIMHNVH